jgi:hypothetical protein
VSPNWYALNPQHDREQRFQTALNELCEELAAEKERELSPRISQVEARVARAQQRGAYVVGWIPSQENPRDVILSDDPPGSHYGICPESP